MIIWKPGLWGTYDSLSLFALESREYFRIFRDVIYDLILPSLLSQISVHLLVCKAAYCLMLPDKTDILDVIIWHYFVLSYKVSFFA